MFAMKFKSNLHLYFGKPLENKSVTKIMSFQKDNIHVKNFIDEDTKYFDNEANLYIFSNTINGYTDYITARSLNFNKKYETSNIKFIMIEIEVGDNLFKIDLKNDKENYYIVQNVFDKDFFLYYLLYYSHNYKTTYTYDSIKPLLDKAIVKIIDENARIFELYLDKNESIEILKDGYNLNKIQ